MTTACSCRDAQIVEGIFGENYRGEFSLRKGTLSSIQTQNELKLYNEWLFSDSADYKKRSSQSYGSIRSFQSESGDGEGGEMGKSLDDSASLRIKSYTLTNSNRMEVVLITWGATIVSLKCPDKFGSPADVVMGFDDLESKSLAPFIALL